MRAYDGNYFCLFLYHFLNPSTVSLLQRSLMGLDADSMICSGVLLFKFCRIGFADMYQAPRISLNVFTKKITRTTSINGFTNFAPPLSKQRVPR